MESTIVLPEADQQMLVGQNRPLVEEGAEFLTICDDAHVALAGVYVQRLSRAIEMVGLIYDNPTAKAHALHKTLTSGRSALLKPLKGAKDDVSRAVRAYERKVAEEMAREAEFARQAERDRLAKELKEAEEARLNVAAAFEAEGQTREADLALNTPMEAPTAVEVEPPPVREKPQGVSMRTTWRFKIINSELIPRCFLVPDMVSIGKHVRENKDRTSIPGIEVYAE